jgi:Domain of unknown function (DUF4384)
MPTPASPRFVQRALPLALAAALGACATIDSAKDTRKHVVDAAQTVKQGPTAAPFKSITNFSDGLRCMDNQLLDYGVRDVSVIVEDILDETKKVNAGTKDMLISAISDMTKRSRAIRPIAYGKDSGNTIGFLAQAQQREHFAVVPPFGIRGSISQFDDAIVRKTVDGGISIEPVLNIGAAKTATASVVGLDLNVLSTSDLAIVSGVSSRNSVIFIKEGKGIDGEATIKKFGINFSMSVARQEGLSQSLRTLVELASIELIGRLARVPYWSCLGASDADPAVQSEITDWYDAMAANPVELIEYFQRQLRARKVYYGRVDGIVNDEFKEAVSRYREALGESREPKFTIEFFRAYLRSDQRAMTGKVAPVLPEAAAPADAATAAASTAPTASAAPTAPAAPLALSVASASAATAFARGAAIDLVIKPNRDAHVYCYLRDDSAAIQRIYPNRFAKDSLVSAARPLDLPGKQRFQIVASPKGQRETVACFATERDVLAELPAAAAGTDFTPLAAASIGELKAAFAGVTRNRFAEGYFNVDVK